MAAKEKRRFKRRVFGNSLEYALSILEKKDLRRIHSAGTAVDLSESGLGFRTDFPLEPGQILILKIENDTTPYAAIIKWVKHQSDAYRVGALLCR